VGVPDDIVLAAVANALPDAVLVIDAQARVRWANRAAERVFGIPIAEAAGKDGVWSR
jgi:PAS domain-containing protein